tara:strand:+ start:4548 stop:4985 length:438 start_codon:yes stop_codon:yes gene_type:complete
VIETIREIAKETLEKMGMYSEDALNLIMETGMAETGFKHLKQMGGGPAIGFFQVEPWVVTDYYDNYLIYRTKTLDKILALGFKPTDQVFSTISNIAVQVALCRIHYRRVPSAIPSTIEERAKYWKKHYNSELGKGTVEHYLKANK